MPMPWTVLLNWKPFQIDALGLVTLLGADEVNAAIGRLVPSRYVEYFPLLGAYVIAGDRFKEKKPSFNLYNITQGFHTTDMSCWLTRWMLAQDFEKNRSIVHFEVADTPRSQWKQRLLAASISFVFTGMLLVMTILSEDWYGIANVTAMIVSILVRAYVLEANRWAIDEALVAAERNTAFRNAKGDKKCMVVMSDSKAVTLEVPGHLIVDVFIDNPKPTSAWAYHLVRWIGWGAFAVHVLAIGQAKLATQLYSIVLLLVPTVLICWKLGCDDSRWTEKSKNLVNSTRDEPINYTCWFGSRLKAHVFQWPLDYEFITNSTMGVGLQHTTSDLDKNPSKNKWYRLEDRRGRDRTRRQDLYAWLNLNEDELESMGKWDLFPHERGHNQQWWNDYKVKNALIQDGPYHLDTVSRNRAIPPSRSKSNSKSKSNGAVPSPCPPPATTVSNSTGNGTVPPPPPINNKTTTNINITSSVNSTSTGMAPSHSHLHPRLHLSTGNLSSTSTNTTATTNPPNSYAMNNLPAAGTTGTTTDTNTATATGVCTGTDTVITPDGRVRRLSATSQH